MTFSNSWLVVLILLIAILGWLEKTWLILGRASSNVHQWIWVPSAGWLPSWITIWGWLWVPPFLDIYIYIFPITWSHFSEQTGRRTHCQAGMIAHSGDFPIESPRPKEPVQAMGFFVKWIRLVPLVPISWKVHGTLWSSMDLGFSSGWDWSKMLPHGCCQPFPKRWRVGRWPAVMHPSCSARSHVEGLFCKSSVTARGFLKGRA